MSTISPLDGKALTDLLARYDIGTPLDHRSASHGIENSNYFVTTRKDGPRCDWVLTLLEQPSNSGPGYVPLLDLCHAAGLPVAPVVRNASGAAIESLLGKQALLAPKLPGTHPIDPAMSQVKALGRFIAELHGATADPGFEVAAYPRGRHWLRDRLTAVRGRIAYTDECLMVDCIDRAVGMLSRTDVRELPTGVIHGDLFRDNVLFDGPELTGVVDFHHAARGYLVYDLAVAANDWCNQPGGLLDPERVGALVAAYDRIRPLAVLERCFFPGFLLYAALAFWLSRLTVALETKSGGKARCKDPDEFKAIVVDRNAHFLNLDALGSGGPGGQETSD